MRLTLNILTLITLSASTLLAAEPEPVQPAPQPKPGEAKPAAKESTPKSEDAPKKSIPDEKAKLAQQYIAALSSDAYMDRADARQKLLELGRPAIEPLEAAARAEDSETRLRATEILIALRGRGFLGIGLEEEDVELPGPDDGFVASDKPGSVRASQIIDWRPYQARFGVKRPFPAAAAGMEMNDRVVEINGRPIHGMKDLMSEVILTGPGRIASVIVERNGTKKRLNVLLTRNPMIVVQNEAGFQQTMPDPKPPVDLEDEADFSDADKRANLKAKDAAADDVFMDE